MAQIPEHIKTRVLSETTSWGLATDHTHLARLFERRYQPGQDELTRQQTAAIGVIQAAGYAVATQMVLLRTMTEINGMLRQYAAIKGGCHGSDV